MDRVHNLTPYKTQILDAIRVLNASSKDSDKTSIKKLATEKMALLMKHINNDNRRLLNKDNTLYNKVFDLAVETLEKNKVIEVNGTTKNKKSNYKRKRDYYYTYDIVSRGKRDLR